MKELYVNVDHIATLREARKTFEPSPLALVKLLEDTAVAGITTHLREDRRHIQDSDIYELSQYLGNSRLGFAFEMAASEDIRAIALRTSADICTIVPENRNEITTEGGLDVIAQAEYLKEFIKPILDSGKKVSFFIEPALDQIAMAQYVGANYIEIHTGRFTNLHKFHSLRTSDVERDAAANLLKIEYEHIKQAVIYACGHHLKVNMGHGLTLDNLPDIAKIDNVDQYHIGHSIISTALIYGLEETTSKFIQALNKFTQKSK
jgi:pyridoxine 5-phosphate synthase